MATRLIGTDSANPILPASVIDASTATHAETHTRALTTKMLTPADIGVLVTKPGLWLSGTTPVNYAATPHIAAYNTTDLMLRARLRRMARKSGASELIANRWNTGAKNVFQWYFDTAGKLTFAWSADGSGLAGNLVCSAEFPGNDSDLYDVQVTFDAASPTNYLIRHWVGIPDDEDAPWATMTQLGTSHTGGAPGVLFAPSGGSESALQVGAFSHLAVNQYMGHIYRFQMRDNPDPNGAGTILANPVFRNDGETSWKPTTPTTTDSATRIWTLNGSAWRWQGNHHTDSTIPLFAYEGDSLTTGQGQSITSGSWWGQANALRDQRTRTEFRAAGNRCVAQAGGSGTALTEDPTILDPFIDPDTDQNYVFGFMGTNDLYYGASAATLQTNYQAWCVARRAAGWKVVVFTILPRSNVGTPGAFAADRLTFNTWLRANYTTFADCLVDVAANTTIGDAGDETNATYYFDLVHMTAAGYTIVASIANLALGTTLGLW